MAEEKICPHGNKIAVSRLYDQRSQKLEFINEGIYRHLRCCGEPMKKITVKATYNCNPRDNQKTTTITIAECDCCKKQISDSDINPTKRFLDWLRQKFSHKDK
ncbi:MAG: hypothetical protein M1334_01645 [Patescibacteria group bacterium]|nr:hypothetical protein [Patescibacteria group bacterium]